MATRGGRSSGTREAQLRRRISTARLDALIEEAIVDAYNESEQAVGFHATIEQHLSLPFETVVLGVTATVKKVGVTVSNHIVAICYRGRERQAIPVLELFVTGSAPLWLGNGSKRIADGPGADGRGAPAMSEYQYYEFRTIDRPLTDRQMRELRAISTRATTSRTSFSNHYEYGDLKANPRDLLLKYFDASLYFAHWLHTEVAFKYAKGAVDVKTLRRYAAGQSLRVTTPGPHVVVTICVEREDFDGADDGTGWLSSVIGLRADIASGDERPLYLAWLLGVQYGEVDDEAFEPGRPDGLGRLSPSLVSFIDIMGLDRDLVAAAAEGGVRTTATPSAQDVDRLLAGLEREELVALLSRVARGDGSVGAEILRRYRKHVGPRLPGAVLRTAGALRERAEALAEARREADRRRAAQAHARRERREQAARGRYLAGLAKRMPQAWQRMDALIATKRPRDYDAAVTLLSDLRDVGKQRGRDVQFVNRVSQLREAHASKPSLLARLRNAGF